MILIISHPKDVHAEVVAEELKKRAHPYYLLDLSQFPAQARLALSYSKLRYKNASFEFPDRAVDFDTVGAIWWRRPQPYTFHDDLKGAIERNFTLNECSAAINGLWMLSKAFWINDPVKDEVASRKPYQLNIAAECGLRIPETLITNDPAKAMEFINGYGDTGVIYKSFLATEQTWRETRLIKKEELERIDCVKYAPVIFQECIESEIDLRVTIIGNSIFPAAIHAAETSYKYDFRMNYHECKILPYTLPREVGDKLLLLMKRLGIVYGAADLRINNEGEYVFLEVNSAGQWLFMEQPTEMPITQTLADTLMENDFANKRSVSRLGPEFRH